MNTYKIISCNVRTQVKIDGVNQFINRVDFLCKKLNSLDADVIGFQEVTELMRKEIIARMPTYTVKVSAMQISKAIIFFNAVSSKKVYSVYCSIAFRKSQVYKALKIALLDFFCNLEQKIYICLCSIAYLFCKLNVLYYIYHNCRRITRQILVFGVVYA